MSSLRGRHIVTGNMFDHMFCYLTKVFDRLQAAKLKRKTMFANQVTYIGHVVSDTGIATHPT